MERFYRIIILSIFFVATAFSALAQILTADNIEEVIAAMTIEEKVTLCIGGANASIVDGVASGSVNEVAGAAGKTNSIDRLGIPSIILADGPAGLRISPSREGESHTYYCTAFPIGTMLASSWDVDLVRKATNAMGDEVRRYGVDIILAPGANIHRNPLCGRNFEYFSEDPVLSGNIAAAYINGLQDEGVGACLKHFAVNNQETNRVENDAIVDSRTLREIYLKNFEIAINKSNPWSIMSSYNRLNGPYTQQSHDLLTNVLRDDWGYNGLVMTDWGRKPDTHLSILAGNDLFEPGTKSEKERLLEAIDNGTITEADLNIRVRNILNTIVKTPHFNKFKYKSDPDLKEHAKVARQIAAESIILLRNERNALPLKGSEKIALYGIGAIDLIPGGTGSGSVNKAYTLQLDNCLKSAGFETDSLLLNYYRKYLELDKITGAMEQRGASFTAKVLSEPKIEEKAIEIQAKNNDVAILVIRRNAGEGEDRKLKGVFELTPEETSLLKDISDNYHKEGKRVIVILNIDGVIETSSWKNLADAIILPWTPGQEGANAIVDVLNGKVNPSGKLPMTFPVSYFDHLSSKNFPLKTQSSDDLDYWTIVAGVMNIPVPEKKYENIDYTKYEEGIWVGYRYFDTQDINVSYPFGYGLSYTSFKFSNPRVKTTKDGLTATITVTNTGNIVGKEVVQLYISAPQEELVKPKKELKSFAKTKELAPGESQTLSFDISEYELSSFNPTTNQWEMEKGKYEILFGSNVNDILATASVYCDKPYAKAVSNAFVTQNQ